MPKPGKILAITRYDIQDRIIDFFAGEFSRPRHEITWNLDVKTYFNYGDLAWATLAGTLSDEFKDLNVKISEAEMMENTTVKKLTYLVWDKIPKLVVTTIESSSTRRTTAKKAKKKTSRSRTKI